MSGPQYIQAVAFIGKAFIIYYIFPRNKVVDGITIAIIYSLGIFLLQRKQ